MSKLLYQDKKAVSEVLSYVILVIIAISLSALVFGYLTLYVPKEKPTCNEEIFLSIQDHVCQFDPDRSNLTLTLLNKGRFSVNAVYVRFGKEGREVKTLINDPELGNNRGSFFLNLNDIDEGLLPDEIAVRNFIPPKNILDSPGNYEVEIQPAVFDKGELAICENAVATQPITC